MLGKRTEREDEGEDMEKDELGIESFITGIN